MKLQLFIISALLIGALAHPVPDEEVSPLKGDALPAEIKSEQPLAQKPLEQPLAKTETPAAAPALEEKKLAEKLALPETAPDAEITQAIPEQKKDEKPAAIEKQTRAEDAASSDPKALPVAQAPVEAEKQPIVAEAAKPATQEVQPVAKNADIPAAETPAAPEATISEQKKEELTALESAPAVKSDIPAPTDAEKPAEEKKEEQPARQERINEEGIATKVEGEVVQSPVVPVPEAPVVSSEPVKPEVKSLTQATEDAKKPEPAAEKPQEPAAVAAPLAELKSEPAAVAAPAAVAKPAEPTAAAGDIPASQLKALPVEPEKPAVAPAVAPAVSPAVVPAVAPASPSAVVPEGKKIEEPSAAVETLPETPIAQAQSAPATENAAAEPLKKLEEIKPAEGEKKPEELKESLESKESDSESKESEESKENKSN